MKLVSIDVTREYAVVLENVYATYVGENKPAIRKINLKIRYGDFVLITGPNGAGKTTLLETILGLLKPTAGDILVLGLRIPEEARLVRRYCSYVPQDFMSSVSEPFLVKYVVAMGLASKKGVFEGLSASEWEEVYKALRMFGVEDLAERPIGKLSGGQQQRVILARAFVRRPRLLILDEPLSYLDKEAKVEVSDLLSKINRDGVTIIMVSHDTSIIPEECDFLVFMEEGTIKEVREI